MGADYRVFPVGSGQVEQHSQVGGRTSARRPRQAHILVGAGPTFQQWVGGVICRQHCAGSLGAVGPLSVHSTLSGGALLHI